MTLHTILLISKYEYIHPLFYGPRSRYVHLIWYFLHTVKKGNFEGSGNKKYLRFSSYIRKPFLILVYDMIGRWYEPQRDADREQAQTEIYNLWVNDVMYDEL